MADGNFVRAFSVVFVAAVQGCGYWFGPKNPKAQ